MVEPLQDHALKQLYDAAARLMPGKPAEDVNRFLHSALLLSYVSAAKQVMSNILIPTPLFRVSYTQGNIGIEDLFGDAPVPNPECVDINATDLLLACQLRGIPLVLEGDTGVGKTHTTEQFFTTVLDGKGHFKSMRMSDNSFGNDVLRPFKEGHRGEDGMLRQKVNRGATRNCAGVFVDEINLALNPNAVMALMDGKVNVGEDEDKVGPLIPYVDEKGVRYNGRVLRAQTVFARNPASDPKYGGAMKLSAALENRGVIYDFPNIAKSAGATLWLPDGVDLDAHKKFIATFTANVAEALGIKDSKDLEGRLLGGQKDEWLDVFAYVVDHSKSERVPLNSAMEFDDLFGFTISQSESTPKLSDVVAGENRKIREMGDALNHKYGTHIAPTPGIVDNSTTGQISQLVAGLREVLEPRDKAQIKRVADAVLTIRKLKEVFSRERPLDAYLAMQDVHNNLSEGDLTLEDFAAAYTFIVRSKRTVPELQAAGLVNQFVRVYRELEEGFCRGQAVPLIEQFNSKDVRRGIKNRALMQSLQYAIEECKRAKGYDGFAAQFIKGLSRQTEILRGVNVTTDPTMAQIATSRLVADLATLAHFTDSYAREINAAAAQGKFEKQSQARAALFDVYANAQKSRGAVAFPDMYKHRLPRVFARWD